MNSDTFDICWDQVAFQSIKKTFDYLKKNVSEKVAEKFKKDVFDAVNQLTHNPERHGYDLLLLEDPPRFRSIRLKDYRIVFEIKQDTVFILFFYHAHQNPTKIKKIVR